MRDLKEMVCEVRKQNLEFIFANQLNRYDTIVELCYFAESTAYKLKKAWKKKEDTKEICYRLLSITLLIGVLFKDEELSDSGDFLVSTNISNQIKLFEKSIEQFRNWKSNNNYYFVLKLALGFFYHFDYYLDDYINIETSKKVTLDENEFGKGCVSIP